MPEINDPAPWIKIKSVDEAKSLIKQHRAGSLLEKIVPVGIIGGLTTIALAFVLQYSGIEGEVPNYIGIVGSLTTIASLVTMLGQFVNISQNYDGRGDSGAFDSDFVDKAKWYINKHNKNFIY